MLLSFLCHCCCCPAVLILLYRSFALGYILCRVVLVAQYIYISIAIDKARWCATRLALGFGVSVLLWSCSLASSEDAVVLPLWTAGLLVDLVTPFLLLGQMLGLHHEHLPERFLLFTVVVLSVMLLEYIDRDFSGGSCSLLCRAAVCLAVCS